MLRCPTCKATYPVGIKFCPKDQARLSPVPGSEPVKPAPAPTPALFGGGGGAPAQPIAKPPVAEAPATRAYDAVTAEQVAAAMAATDGPPAPAPSGVTNYYDTVAVAEAAAAAAADPDPAPAPAPAPAPVPAPAPAPVPAPAPARFSEPPAPSSSRTWLVVLVLLVLAGGIAAFVLTR